MRQHFGRSSKSRHFPQPPRRCDISRSPSIFIPSGGKVIGIVSALPGEGKTTVSIAFAAFVAKSGSRVLLVDGDLRNPSTTKSLGYANAPGLINMIVEKSDVDRLVITDWKYKFDFLPSSTQSSLPIAQIS